MNLTVTTDISGALNVTIYYNATGGFSGLGSSILTTIVNTTSSQTNFNYTSFDITSLADLSTYNFSAYTDNGTSQEFSSSISDVTIDNTVPNVTLLIIPASSASYSGSVVLNVSVNDSLIGVDSVYFNITNSSGAQINFTKASASGIYYNATLDTIGFTGGTYNITVFANDSLGNLNNSIVASNIIFDNTVPVVTLTSSSRTSNSLVLSIGVSDAAATTCTTSRGSISGTTLTESSLSCGNSYSYVVTCTDVAGNSGVSSSTSFSTSSCGGGSRVLPDGWLYSNSVSASSILAGSARVLRKSQITQFVFNGATHHVGVKNISGDVVTVEVASDPVEYDFNIGDERKFDLNNDDVYDLYVRLDSVSSGIANVFIKIIEEIDSYEDVIGIGGQDEEIIGDDVSSGDDFGILGDIAEDGKSHWIVWLVLIVLIIGIVLIIWFVRNKNNGSKKRRR